MLVNKDELDFQTKREIERWYKLDDVQVQLDMIRENKRFVVAPAGRRSGKTERAKRKLAKDAMQNPGEIYFASAPVHEQAKKIWWRDLKLLTFSSLHKRPPSESERIIYLPNGTEIHVFGLDKPERMEGTPWTGGVIDEIGNTKPEAWQSNIRPALDTYYPHRPGFQAWCWLIGVPEGMNHYYDLAEYARTSGDPDWGHYHWKSSEVMSVEAIEAARRELPPRLFRQEYEASFETVSGRIYEDYGDNNVKKTELRPHEQIKWCHDFNFTPLSSAVCVEREGCYYVVDEIVLTSAVAKQSAQEFVVRYKDHANKNILLYGDPAGKAGEKHGHSSDYVEIETVLRQNGWVVTRCVRQRAPAIVDRQNAVRRYILNAAGDIRFFVNPDKAEYTHKGLGTVQVKEGSTFLEQDGKYQHITTAIGYMVEYDHPMITNLQEETISEDFSDELDYTI